MSEILIMTVYSVVIPVYNEEDSLPVLFRELYAVMRGMGKPFEILFVNDGSFDRSAEIIDRFVAEHPQDVRGINLNQRNGQTFALKRGLDTVKGEIVITLDADLQNDPADIPRLIAKLEEGNFDVVCGWRRTRQDRLLKVVFSKLGNIFQRMLTGLTVHDVSCTLRVYKRSCIDKIALNREGMHRFIPLSLVLQGCRAGEIESNHRLRKFGRSKYGHQRILKVVIDFFRLLASRGRA